MRVERRSFPRPPLWLNLFLLLVAAAVFAYAARQRNQIRSETATLFSPLPNTPADVNQIRDQLSQLDLTRGQLAQQLDQKMAYLQSLEGQQFYISIDTTKKTMQFRLGKDVVREAPVVVGPPATIHSTDGRTWTFYPLKGGFNVAGTDSDYSTAIPAWVYALHNEPVPANPPVMQNWLGKYVIFLPNNYVIDSPPPPGSPLQGPKPGSFMVPEADLVAIWPRITKDTRVYIF